MKKIIALVLTLTFTLLSLASCKRDDTKINIGVMSGPTGMGMAKLMNDEGAESEKYEFEIYSDPTNGTTDLMSKKLDMLCLPTNAAANLFTKQKNISVIAINCLGSLYLLANNETEINSIKDLEGKTIYSSVATSTTKPIIDFILKENGVNATVEIEKDHDTLVAKLASKEVNIAVLPEPKVTAALIANKDYSVKLNLSEEWSKVSDTPLTMGCIVVRNDFLEEHKSVVDSFLKDYKASIDFINDKNNNANAAEMIVSAGVLPKLPVAKGALNNLYGSIVYIEGDEMKNALKAFYTAIGLAQPDEAFYYEK
ncbi:MAG: ABC transporter substrate-binding protein [Clostridia bacterium]|nr:ABC transporter substrate-binding protein [Clostridia bacterium]